MSAATTSKSLLSHWQSCLAIVGAVVVLTVTIYSHGRLAGELGHRVESIDMKVNHNSQRLDRVEVENRHTREAVVQAVAKLDYIIHRLDALDKRLEGAKP